MGSTGVNTPENRYTREEARRISDCLCKIDPSYCVNINDINAAPGGLIAYLLGVMPAGETNILGEVTINSKLYNRAYVETAEGAQELRETVAHESLHVNQNAAERWRSERNIPDSSAHDNIYEKSWNDVNKNYRDKIEECMKRGCL